MCVMPGWPEARGVAQPAVQDFQEWDDFNLRNFLRECAPKIGQNDPEWEAAQVEWQRRHGAGYCRPVIELDPA